MGRCKNRVSQFIEKGFGHKEVKSPCGSTGQFGEQLICNKCEAKLKKQYPQGWRETPGDLCKHGTYVGDRGGPDYMCGACENGE